VKRLLVCLLLMGGCIFAAAQERPKTPALASPLVEAAKKANSNGPDDGEKRFEANCGRCHNAPENLSPREARAVVRQMRVRARLTAEDERLILQYLAP
jgi:cytochrome c5